MLVKAGVDISRLNREIRRSLSLVSAYFRLKSYELIITSTFEGVHSPGSLHYSNDAFDFRYPESYNTVNRSGLTNELGDDFDVVFEKDHIHIEYDP